MRLLVLVLDKQEGKFCVKVFICWTPPSAFAPLLACLMLHSFLKSKLSKARSFKTTSMASYPFMFIQNKLQVFFLATTKDIILIILMGQHSEPKKMFQDPRVTIFSPTLLKQWKQNLSLEFFKQGISSSEKSTPLFFWLSNFLQGLEGQVSKGTRKLYNFTQLYLMFLSSVRVFELFVLKLLVSFSQYLINSLRIPCSAF